MTTLWVVLVTAAFVTLLQLTLAARSVVDCRVKAVAEVGQAIWNPGTDEVMDNVGRIKGTFKITATGAESVVAPALSLATAVS